MAERDVHRHDTCDSPREAHDCYCARPKEAECPFHAIVHATDQLERRRIYKSRWPDEDDERIARNFPSESVDRV